MKKLMEMLAEKSSGKSEMNDKEKMAKMDVLKELMELAMEQTGEDVKEGMKKITVASPSKEGLMKGLEKAEDMMEESSEDEMMSEEDEMMSEEEMFMDEEMSEEDEEDEEMKKKMRKY